MKRNTYTLCFLLALLLCACSEEKFPEGAQLSLEPPVAKTYSLQVNTTSLSFGYNSNLIATLSVTADNTQWQLDNLPSWLTASATKGSSSATITLVAQMNTTDKERSAVLNFHSDESSYSYQKSISVTQSAAYFDVVTTGEIASSQSCTLQLSVSSNMEWTASTNFGWLRLSSSKGSGDATLILTVDSNPSVNERTGKVTFVTSKATKVLSFTQPGKQVVDDNAVRSFTVTGNGQTVTFKMIKVQAGTFQMGSDDSDAYNDEELVHTVTLTNDYYMGETEVTQALWQAVMGSNPSNFSGSNKPVECVSWNDCQTFIAKLNSLTGGSFRLPTEAEWEYAARGGQKSKGYKYAGSNTIDDVAWYTVNSYYTGSSSDYGTHIVKTKQANELGLYDMSGNVWEWCQDWYGSYSSSTQTNPTGPSSGSYRVIRGGGWYYDAGYCRVAIRNYGNPAVTSNGLGLRLASQ